MTTKIDFDFDFGFTTEDDVLEEVSTKAADAKKALLDLRKMIEPLLKNLEANPEKPIINWPNRAEKVQEFRQKLDNFVESRLKEL